jgi:NhaA family Na+:H+ antiporter
VSRHRSHQALPSAQLVTDRLFSALERFLYVEAVSGIVLLVAAVSALLWANSPAADSYQHLWHAPLTIGFGGYVSSQSLHFWINDALMTVFFLVVGMEIRREIAEGALANLQLAALPFAAAAGGVALPALVYLAINADGVLRQGWAIPTATDIAFALGVLALLGRSISGAVRVFLLALAIIDDVAAVIIIATFYSGGLDYSGFLIAGIGVLLVLGFQKIGIGTAYAYIVPGAILWFGLLQSGAHPTLAGVALGLLTPVVSRRAAVRPLDVAIRALNDVGQRFQGEKNNPRELLEPLKQLRYAEREMLPPVVRVQMALHPWVAYGVMPLFALANAGVSFEGMNLTGGGSQSVMLGIFLALVIGKPVGIVAGSWIAVRLGWCRLPPGVTWQGVLLIGCLGGIGFTMSIFIATLAFTNEALLAAAKAGVLFGSAAAAIIGLTLGAFCAKRVKPLASDSDHKVERS